jgi:hypothetical protein
MLTNFYIFFKEYLTAFLTPQFYVRLLHYWDKPDRLGRIFLCLCFNFNSYFFFYLMIGKGLNLRRFERLRGQTYQQQWLDLFSRSRGQLDYIPTLSPKITNLDPSLASPLIFYNSLPEFFNLKKKTMVQNYLKLSKLAIKKRNQLGFEATFKLFKKKLNSKILDQFYFLFKIDHQFREIQFFNCELENLKFEIFSLKILQNYFLLNKIFNKNELKLAIGMLADVNVALDYRILVLEKFIFYHLKL